MENIFFRADRETPRNPEENREGAALNQMLRRREMLMIMGLSALSSVISIENANGTDASENAQTLEDNVDVIEINHFHDDQGRPVFDQVIFYDWSMEDKRYHVRDWRLLKNANQRPLRDSATGEYSAIWSDFKCRDAIRITRSKLFDETWTMYDPELLEREFLAEGKRKKLKEIPPLPQSWRCSAASEGANK